MSVFKRVHFCFVSPQASPRTLISVTFSIRPGIRLLDGPVTDAMEATALTFNIHFIDIYVCSWGPRDNGAEMDGPHGLTAQALRLGTHKARLSSPSSHSRPSDVEQISTLSVELRLGGQNVECWHYIDGFKYKFRKRIYKMIVHTKGLEILLVGPNKACLYIRVFYAHLIIRPCLCVFQM